LEDGDSAHFERVGGGVIFLKDDVPASQDTVYLGHSSLARVRGVAGRGAGALVKPIRLRIFDENAHIIALQNVGCVLRPHVDYCIDEQGLSEVNNPVASGARGR